jgi:CheY-like chemotaxis protein
MKVLLAEDNAINREIACYFLKELHCEITTATNGAEAVSAALLQAFDVIFMDIQMPELSGVEATERIRSLEKSLNKKTPIVAITAYTSQFEIDEFLAAGMTNHIAKPLSVEKLREAMRLCTNK